MRLKELKRAIDLVAAAHPGNPEVFIEYRLRGEALADIRMDDGRLLLIPQED
jgi:hypothetical protein